MADRPRAPRRPLALAVALASLILAATAGPAAAGFPARDSAYHDYAEMVTEIKAIEAAKPAIVDVRSIGKSYQGRDIWIAKISDNVLTDEPEPEILFDALHHAREHFTVEQALYLLRTLANGYASDATVKGLVDGREIWIIFMLNPDGAEFDLTCGGSHAPYCAWRKNRQPNAGTSAVGTDLNRNYDYRWACCGGSSGSPSSITYRGPSPFSAPETRVMRDFVNGRVVNGVQQIRAHVTLHTNGRLILWPYGYTKANQPSDMTAEDHATFVTMGRAMAARNGYTPQQSSDLYITDGDQIDWMYGVHRIFSFTWELYPPETSTVWGDHYPPDEAIAPETARNRSALLYTIDVGGCPYGAIGKTRTHCGPYFDDLEGHKGWVRDPAGTDSATSGQWTRANPAATWQNSVLVQPDATSSGSLALVTGGGAGASAGANDLDGLTSVASAPIQLPANPGPLAFRYYFSHAANSSSADSFQAYVMSEGSVTRVFREHGSALPDAPKWQRVSLSLGAWAGKSVRILFVAADAGPDSTVEAGVDDVRIERPSG